MNKRNRAKLRQQQRAAWTDPPEPSSSEGEPDNVRICLPHESDETQRPWWTQLGASARALPTADVIAQLKAKLQECLEGVETLSEWIEHLSCRAKKFELEFHDFHQETCEFESSAYQRFNRYDTTVSTVSAIGTTVKALEAQTQRLLQQVTADNTAMDQRLAALEAAAQQPQHATALPQHAAPVPAPSRPPATSWASAVRGKSPQQQQPRAQPRARQPTGSPNCPGLAAITSQRCCFVVSGSPAETAALDGRRGADLAADISALIIQRLKLSAGEVRVLDAIPLGKVLPTDPPTRRRRFFIRVERLAQADAIVANRHALKGAQLAIFDELSPEERATHRLLWPTFVEARRLGLTAQFSRANLTVSKRKDDGAILQRYTIWP